MNDLEIDVLLDRWSDRIEKMAPAEDPRRTENCLRFDEIAKLTHNQGKEALLKRQSHIPQCAWCQSAIAKIVSLLENEVEGQYVTGRGLNYPAQNAASFREETSPFVAGLGTYVGNWLREQSVPMEEDTPAYFDEQGTLHLTLSGLQPDGELRAGLLIDGASMNIGTGEVIKGRLAISRALPEFGLTSVRLPAALIELMPAQKF